MTYAASKCWEDEASDLLTVDDGVETMKWIDSRRWEQARTSNSKWRTQQKSEDRWARPWEEEFKYGEGYLVPVPFKNRD